MAGDWIPRATQFQEFFAPNEDRLQRLVTDVLPYLEAARHNGTQAAGSTTSAAAEAPPSLLHAIAMILGTTCSLNSPLIRACEAYMRLHNIPLWVATSVASTESTTTASDDGERESPSSSQAAPLVFSDLLVTLIQEALCFPTYFPTPLSKDPLCVSWSKQQVFSILACALLCLFPRPSNNCCTDDRRFEMMPSINYDEMIFPEEDSPANISIQEKMLMFLDYVAAIHKRRHLWSHEAVAAPATEASSEAIPVTSETTAENDNILLRPLVIIRHSITPEAVAELLHSAGPVTQLTPFTVHPLRHSIDDASHMLRVDFANSIIGGASIAYGCVQEEITFSVCPELNAARLVHSPMKHTEAIVLCGVEQFSLLKPGTYGFGMRHGGVVDPSPCPRGGAIVAIDAMDYRYVDTEEQYKWSVMRRELTKLLAAFLAPVEAHGGVPPEEASNVATGNWGCGVFAGDLELKFLLQWIACSLAKKHMHYFPFDERRVEAVMVALGKRIVDGNVTVADLVRFLRTVVEPNSRVLGSRRRSRSASAPSHTVWSLLNEFIADFETPQQPSV
jgi:hypothetical protein